MSMKRMAMAAMVLAAMAAGSVAADPVVPATLALTLVRDAEETQPTAVYYFQGDSLSFSNSTMYATATSGTNGTVQNLDGCAIWGTIGDSTTNTYFTGGAISTNAGTWWATTIVPAVNPSYIEITVSNVNTYTYERVKINTRAHQGQ
jgi:hypothetical protein